MKTVCPRCGYCAYERLRTHSYCIECNYSPDIDGRLRTRKPRNAKQNKKHKKDQKPISGLK